VILAAIEVVSWAGLMKGSGAAVIAFAMTTSPSRSRLALAAVLALLELALLDSASSGTLPKGEEGGTDLRRLADASKAPQKSVFSALDFEAVGAWTFSGLRMPSNVVFAAAAPPIEEDDEDEKEDKEEEEEEVDRGEEACDPDPGTMSVGNLALNGVCTPNFLPQRHSLG
jgi:hypothetical protein